MNQEFQQPNYSNPADAGMNANQTNQGPQPGFNPQDIPNAGVNQGPLPGFNPQGNQNAQQHSQTGPNPQQQQQYTQTGPNPQQQQNTQAGPNPQQQQQQQEQQYRASLAEELKRCWTNYQQAKKICDDLGDNPELRKVIEETAYQQFREAVQETLASHVKSTCGPTFSFPKVKPSFDWLPKKKLYRSAKDKLLAGVCGGLGEHFDFDSTIVRIIFVITALPWTWCLGGFLYIALMILLPVKYDQPS